MKISGADWKAAQLLEKRHWQGFMGKDTFWPNLWKAQAGFLWPLFPDARNVLEIGPGPLGLIRWAPGSSNLYAIDPLAEEYPEIWGRLDMTGLRTDIEYLCQPAEDPVPDFRHKFNLILALDCLDHTELPEKVLDNLFLYLDPGGYFVESTTIFNYRHPDVLNQYTKLHPWVWTWGELFGLVAGHGFILEDVYENWPCHENFSRPESNSYQSLRVWRPLP